MKSAIHTTSRWTVVVNGHVKYQGSTSEISHKAGDVFAWLGFIAPLKPGSVMGFGTIPDCTGCDHDDFIDPGAEIQITIERLGTLHCRFVGAAGQAAAEPLAGSGIPAEVPSMTSNNG
jgi:2-keto-4-pentenoate hydratase/2-oxohepta-3-ene-1,7-dioic acid hydratase in catechol pathway